MAPRFPLALRERLEEAARRLPADPVQAFALRAFAQAERVLTQLDSTARVLDQVARTQLTILKKLEPIVDDLGELVKLQLADARRRLLGRGHAPPDD